MTSPWMHSILLTAANTPYSLYDLIAATFGSTPQPPKWQSVNAQFCAIQVDSNSANLAGSEVQIAIGNANVSFTDCGVILFSGQTFPIYSMEASLINFKDIWVVSNNPNIRLNISFIQR